MTSWLSVGKEIIKLGAPLIGFAIGGPMGSEIVSAVEELFGADQNNPDDLLTKIRSTSDSSLKLKTLENNRIVDLQNIMMQYQEKLYTFEQQYTDDDVKDTESARAMELQTKSYMPHILTLLLAISLCLSLGAFFFVQFPASNKEIIIGLLLLNGWLFMLACRFWFGGIIPKITDLEKKL